MASKNLLGEGDARIGWYYDNRPETPETVVQLTLEDGRPTLRVPIGEGARDTDHPLHRYFARDIWDDSLAETSAARPPDEILFCDSRGAVALVGCVARHGSTALGGMRTSEGRIVADYAVLGAEHGHFSKLNGVQMKSAAVSQWVGLSSVTFERELDDDGLLREGAVRFRGAPSTRVGRKLNLAFKPTWTASVDPGTGESSGRAMSVVQTQVDRPRPWHEHRDLMRAVLDLVGVAGWEEYTAQELSVRRDDAPLRTADGTARGDKWLALVQREVPTGDLDAVQRYRFLFTYGDLRHAAIDTWLALRRRYPRAINPLVALPKMRKTYLENQLLQSAIALDALGNYLEDEVFAGAKRNKSGQLAYNDALRNLASVMDWAAVPDVEDWVGLSNATYMGAKHVDRDEVTANEMLDGYVANSMMLRAWVAQRLGVPEERFRRELFPDPLGRYLDRN